MTGGGVSGGLHGRARKSSPDPVDAVQAAPGLGAAGPEPATGPAALHFGRAPDARTTTSPDEGPARATSARPEPVSEPTAGPMPAATAARASGEARTVASEPTENDPTEAATPAGPDHQEGPQVTTPTITTPPPAADPIGVDIHVIVGPTTAIEVHTFTNGACVRFGQGGYGAGLRLAVRGVEGAEHDLPILEDFLERARIEVTKARLRMLPCQGACQPLLWPAEGFICSAYNTDLDATCSRVEGHDGQHCSCPATDHAIHVWPRRKVA